MTPPGRTLSVWRGVPMVENTALHRGLPVRRTRGHAAATGPGRAARPQPDPHRGGRGASRTSSPPLSRRCFRRIAPESVADQLEAGVAQPTSRSRGRACRFPPSSSGDARSITRPAGCHGGATDTVIKNRAAHDQLFFALQPDGNLVFQNVAGRGLTPVLSPHPRMSSSASALPSPRTADRSDSSRRSMPGSGSALPLCASTATGRAAPQSPSYRRFR